MGLSKSMEIAAYSILHLIRSNAFLSFQKADFDRLPHVRQHVRRQIQFDDAEMSAAVDEDGAFLRADDASGFGIAISGDGGRRFRRARRVSAQRRGAAARRDQRLGLRDKLAEIAVTVIGLLR